MKEAQMRYMGSIQQMAYIRRMRYCEGRMKGMDAFEVKNQDLMFHVMADKCLDISELSYRGRNLTFLSKPGLQGRNAYDTNGTEAQRSIMGGLFFTCGLDNICAPCTIEGREYPMHGRIRTTPAEYAGADAHWEGEDYVLSISGEMRQAELFGENMVLRRKIETRLGERVIRVTDEIENQSFRPEPLLLMYHCNLGYPLLDEHLKLYLPTRSVIGREEFSQEHIASWNRMERPKDQEQEYVYIHTLSCDDKGDTLALAVNSRQELGVSLEFNVKSLPYFMEWKSIASGDYVMGLEPSNGPVYGRAYAKEHSCQRVLGPQEKECFHLTFTILGGEEEIEEAIGRIREMEEKK